ncbi:MAG: hypothetical protein J7K31_01695 [Candidatus Aenigmarchaeota archaeon]|nr:hypothetical protein [Candidatus Aenigmarchaeota archaeon]
MKKLFYFVIFLLVVKISFSADITLIVNNNNSLTTEEQNAVNLLESFGFDYNVQSSLDNLSAKVLWIHSAERNNPQFLVNRLENPENLEKIRSFMRYGGKIFLTHNAIAMTTSLGIENVRAIKRSDHWNPIFYDELSIVIEKSSEITKSFTPGQRALLWVQYPGQDDQNRYQTRNISGTILGHYYQEYNGHINNYINIPSLVSYQNAIAFFSVRLSPIYHPTPTMKQIINASLSYLLRQASINRLRVNITDIGETTSPLANGLRINFTVSLDGQPVIDLDNTNSSIFVEGEAPTGDIYWADYGGGRYAWVIEKPKLVGNLSISVTVNYDGILGSGIGHFYTKTRHREHLMMITDNNFDDILFSSILEYPVLIYGVDDFDQIQYFVDNYDPNEIFSTSDVRLGGYGIKREFIKEQWPGSGVIVIDDNRTKSLWAGVIATLMNMRLTREPTPDAWFCTFDCSSTVNGSVDVYDTEEELMQYYFSLLRSTRQKINYLALVNVRDNRSALLPQLVRLRGAFPVIVDINPGWSNEKTVNETRKRIKETIDILQSRDLLSDDYLFDNTMFLGIIGVPLGLVEDPADEYFNDKDGDYIETDVFYGDSDGDGYQDLAVGRFFNSIQIANIRIWNRKEVKDKKNVLIAAEYRSPSYLDLLPNGMDEGLITDWSLRLFGFKVKRLTEQRLTDFMTVNKDKAIDEAWTWKELEHLFVQQLLKILSVQKHINWALTAKYALVETDWEKFFEMLRIGQLDKLTKEDLLEYLNRHGTAHDYNIFFYFGVGDTDKLLIHPDGASTISDPYPESDQTIYHNDLDFHEPKILFLEHTMSAHSSSKFLKKTNLVLVGETGIIHQVNSALTLAPFIQQIVSKKSIGKAVEEMHDILIFGERHEEVQNRITFSAVEGGMKNALKEHYTRILYGDPALSLEAPGYVESNWIISPGGATQIKTKTNYTIENNTIVVNNADDYILEYNKPIIPLYHKRIILPTNTTIDDVSWNIISHAVNATPQILEPDKYYQKENFTGVYPNQTIWNDTKQLIDGRQVLLITVAAIQYNGSQATIIDDINVSVSYHAPIDILSFNITNISRTEKEFIVNIKSNRNQTVNLTLRLETNETVEYINKTIQVSGIHKEMIRKNMTEGTWKVSVGIKTDNGERAGPRSIVFTVEEKEHRSKQKLPMEYKKMYGPGLLGEELKNPFETVRYVIKDASSVFEYWNNIEYLKIKKSPKSVQRIFVVDDAMIDIFENSSEQQTVLVCPKGKLWTRMYNGTIEESFVGRGTELEKIMAEVLDQMQQEITKIRERIESKDIDIDYQI